MTFLGGGAKLGASPEIEAQPVKTAVISVLLCFGVAAYGQSTKKPVYFQCACTDSVGARVATAVRDLIALSPRYRPVGEFVSGTGDAAVWNWGLRCVSIDPSQGDVGQNAVFSVTITIGRVYQTSYVQVCGTAKIADCAATIMADLDNQASN